MAFNGLDMMMGQPGLRPGGGLGLRAPQMGFGLGGGGSPLNMNLLSLIAPMLMQQGQTPLAPPMPPMMNRATAPIPNAPQPNTLNPADALKQPKKRLSEGLYGG